MSLTYELHLTIENPKDSIKLQEACEEAKVNLITIELSSTEDVMTSSKVSGQDEDALAEANKIEAILVSHGFNVLRKKIEAPPWHIRASMPFEEQNYLEAHIPVEVEGPTALLELAKVASKVNAHLSRNALRPGIHMVTYRSREDKGSFYKSLLKVEEALWAVGFPGSYRVEFALYDTNVKHDEAWLKGN